jgi:predicted nucleic acid-binding protein
MRRSFPDSGVLIDAARGLPPYDRIAFEYFNSPDRIFLTSPLVRLETVPKAAYLRLQAELDFYEAFFNHPEVEYCGEWERLEETADRAARQFGLSAMDALHIAAAYLLGADELVTTERPSKPIYRNRLVEVVYLYANL